MFATPFSAWLQRRSIHCRWRTEQVSSVLAKAASGPVTPVSTARA